MIGHHHTEVDDFHCLRSVQSQRKQREGSEDKQEIPVWSFGGYYFFLFNVAYSSVFILHLSHFSGDVGRKEKIVNWVLGWAAGSSAPSIFHGINKKRKR